MVFCVVVVVVVVVVFVVVVSCSCHIAMVLAEVDECASIYLVGTCTRNL